MGCSTMKVLYVFRSRIVLGTYLLLFNWYDNQGALHKLEQKTYNKLKINNNQNKPKRKLHLKAASLAPWGSFVACFPLGGADLLLAYL